MMISDISHITMGKISAGSFSASVSKDAGELYIWGSGPFGEFLTPHRVKTIVGATKSVEIGLNFGIALSQDGYLYSWGVNTFGELGTGDYRD